MKVNYSKTTNAEVIGNKIYHGNENNLVAQVYLKNYNYISFKFNPKSNVNVYAEAKLFKYKEPARLKKTKVIIFNDKDTYICQNCGRRIIKVYAEKLFDYALYVECSCGAAYNSGAKFNTVSREKTIGEYFSKKYLQTYLNMLS